MSEGGELQEYGQMEPKALLQLALNMIAVTRLVLSPSTSPPPRPFRPSATTAASSASPTAPTS
ncbi:MAG: hypothetical protein ACLUNV_05895 [Sutterella wadsworthensis]